MPQGPKPGNRPRPVETSAARGNVTPGANNGTRGAGNGTQGTGGAAIYSSQQSGAQGETGHSFVFKLLLKPENNCPHERCCLCSWFV